MHGGVGKLEGYRCVGAPEDHKRLEKLGAKSSERPASYGSAMQYTPDRRLSSLRSD